jgi:hypothetical protein
VQSYPVEWFTRSNFGGRFGAMMKYAGWDGIVIEGKADKPVWIDIRDQDVRIKDAKRFWGMDTWKTQEEIWQEVGGDGKYGKWMEPAGMVPVVMPATDRYTSVQSGLVDVDLLGAMTQYEYKLYEVAKYVSTIELGTFSVEGIFMNLDSSSIELVLLHSFSFELLLDRSLTVFYLYDLI